MAEAYSDAVVIIMSGTTQSFKKQLPRNVLASLISFVTYTISAVWLTPYLLEHLGDAAYSLVPLAGLFTQYVAMLSDQLQGAVGRFMTIEVQKPDGNPNTIFNSALLMFLVLAVLQIPLFVLGIYYADKVFTIPEGVYIDTLILLGCSAGSFLVTLIGMVFSVSTFAKNRLDIGYWLNISRLILRLVAILVLFSMFGAKLRYIGYVDLVLSILLVAGQVYWWKRLTPELRISFSSAKWAVLKPVFDMSIWSLLTRIGSILYLRSDIWIINRFISPAAAGQYAAILVVANFVRQVAGQFSGQLTPTIMGYWAKEDYDNLNRLLVFGVKILALGLTIPVAFICANGGHILSWWLGESYASQAALLFVLCIHLPINCAVIPMFHLQTASNRIKLPAQVTFVMGVLNLIVSYVLGVTFEMGAMGVALATAVILTLKNAIFTPIHSELILGVKRGSLVYPPLLSIVLVGMVYAFSQVPLVRWMGLAEAGIVGLLLQGGIVGLVSLFLIWFAFITKKEKSAVAGMLPPGLRKYLFI